MNAQRRRASPAAGLALLALMAAAGRGQSVEAATGAVKATVRDAFGSPIVGAQVSLAGSTAKGETNERGEVLMSGVAMATVTVRVRRIGFRPDTAVVTVAGGRPVTVDIVLTRLALDLQPVVVVGRKQLIGPMAGFYARKSRGVGHFFTADDLEKLNQTNMIDVLRRTPGVRVLSRGMSNRVIRFRDAKCAPLTWLNGFPLYAGEYDLDGVDPRSFDGVEIYSGSASVPIEFLGNQLVSSSDCGTIVLWSRQGDARLKAQKSAAPSAAAQIARLLEENSVYTASQVDTPARPDPMSLVHPVYPDSLFDRGVAGKVLSEFVVSAAGEVVMETFSVVTTSHEAFGEAVRRAIRLQRYTPAIRSGKAVPQVVQQPFDFVPDSTAIRKR